MSTDTASTDDLHVPHLKERLWQELAELHSEHRPAATQLPGLGASAGDDQDRLRRRHRRGVTPARWGAAAAAVLLVGVVAVNLAVAPSDPPATTTSETILVQRIVAATDGASADSVLHVVDQQVSPDGARQTVEVWIDETSGASRFLRRDAQGRPVLDAGPLRGPTASSTTHTGQRTVDHCARRYVDHLDTGAASLDIDAGGLGTLQDLVSAGALTEDGTEVVDGRTLVRLTSSDGVLWVDPASYRPVASRGRYAGTGERYEQTYEYLPRTEANLRLLQPHVPDGFVQVDPLADGEWGACVQP